MRLDPLDLDRQFNIQDCQRFRSIFVGGSQECIRTWPLELQYLGALCADLALFNLTRRHLVYGRIL